MHEILRHLPEGARVLDVGSRSGSFDAAMYPVRTIRVDLDVPVGTITTNFVRADAAGLPFASASFDAIVANHSLEHFEGLDASLRELDRVVKPAVSIYIAVPDSSTMEDRLYRWLASVGGHVNTFSSAGELTALVEQHTGMQLSAKRSLLTSLSFLNRKNRTGKAPRKLILLGGGREGVLVA